MNWRNTATIYFTTQVVLRVLVILLQITMLIRHLTLKQKKQVKVNPITMFNLQSPSLYGVEWRNIIHININKYKTIPIAVQYLKQSHGQIDWGAMMAVLVLAIVPIVIFYIICQKYIIEGVLAGAVKG